jgi:hypothetical protein
MLSKGCGDARSASAFAWKTDQQKQSGPGAAEHRCEHTLGKEETFLEYYRPLVDHAAWLLIYRPPELPIKLAALNQPQLKPDRSYPRLLSMRRGIRASDRAPQRTL